MEHSTLSKFKLSLSTVNFKFEGEIKVFQIQISLTPYHMWIICGFLGGGRRQEKKLLRDYIRCL